MTRDWVRTGARYENEECSSQAITGCVEKKEGFGKEMSRGRGWPSKDRYKRAAGRSNKPLVYADHQFAPEDAHEDC